MIVFCIYNHFYSFTSLCFYTASFPGPTQLSVSCRTKKQFFIRAWGEPGNEASFYVLQAIKN